MRYDLSDFDEGSVGASVLIVEDEFLVASDMEATIEELGYTSVGIAPDMECALALAQANPDIALVDLNLRDGPTGSKIGAILSERGVAVVFVTANPRVLGAGIPGTFGVLSKPCDETCIGATIDYALMRSRGEHPTPPAGLSAFS